nr:Gamma-glutamyl phosphate reductase (EC 1.2.1.41) [uncultured bacterium]
MAWINGFGGMNMQVKELSQKARYASYTLSTLPEDQRNAALNNIQQALKTHAENIFEQNKLDCAQAEEENIAFPLLKRLKFDEEKLEDVLYGISSLISLPDPLGRTTLARELAPGLNLYRVTCPIGVIGVIFESRPDALVQIASLCLKSGNATLMKGGREALRTNRALMAAMEEGAKGILPDGWAALLETRDDVNEMLSQDDSIDLIIPRGSNAFVRYIMDHTRIPVMGHAEGLCHTYVDASAYVPIAVRVTVDAKTQALAVCNATETLLVHRDIAAEFLPKCAERLKAKGVELRGDERTQAIIDCIPATEQDWATEYLDAILSIKIVDSIEEAIAHINRYGSHHTDAIIAQDETAQRRFLMEVDSAGVYVNCSTRFADGFRYGFGAEVGISTGKLHARGPVGLEGLCTYKYHLIGSGQTVRDTATGRVQYTHRDL